MTFNAMSSIAGLRIVESVLCTRQAITYTVERHTIRKHRRNWRVVRHEKTEPTCYQTRDAIYMHPEIYAKLKVMVP